MQARKLNLRRNPCYIIYQMRFILLVLSLIIIGGLAFYLWPKPPAKINQKESVKEKGGQIMDKLTLKSPAFSNQESIPKKYTCEGENINPPLEIGGVPQTAKSLVLIMDDPDAPSRTWTHWTVWNISPTTKDIEENIKPEGVEGVTSFGNTGYGGPCPPPALTNRGESGTHRYFFKLYALDTKLDLPSSTRKAELEKSMEGHILEKTELLGLYSRAKF